MSDITEERLAELRDEMAQLSDEELSASIEANTAEFRQVAAATTFSTAMLNNLRELKAAITSAKDEQASRTAAAEALVAEIDGLAEEVLGDSVAAAAEPVVEAEAEPEAIEPTAVIDPPAVTASAGGATRRASLDLSAVRARQASNGTLSRYAAVEPVEGIVITAAVDVPGFRPGQEFSVEDITEGVMRRATSLKTAGGGTGMVASYQLPFSKELSVNDSSSATEGYKALDAAVNQKNLPGGNLVASGGWCAVSETVYDIADIACPDMLWDLPEIQLNRGGLRFYRTPALDVNALTWVHTEADDIAGNPKPCFVIPCATPVEARAEAQGVCLQAGILTSRFFPEMIDWYVRNSMIAHEIRLKTRAYELARTSPGTTAVTIPVSFAAFSAVYAAISLQAADMIERFNLCDSIALEVTLPWWSRAMFMSDIARQQGVKPSDLDPNIIQQAFTQIGVRIQWARGLTPDVPTNIGGAVPATGWPADLEFLIYPAGNFVLGRGPEVNLGVVIDSVLMAQNNEKIFSEEAVVLIDKMAMARRVTVTVCPNGSVGAVPTTAAACPIA